MGKKKATKAKRIRPIIEQAIKDGAVYVKSRGLPKYDLERIEASPDNSVQFYIVSFGLDLQYRHREDVIVVYVNVHDNGSLTFNFQNRQDHMLDRANHTWFESELEQIITMHKLGAFASGAGDIHGRHDQRDYSPSSSIWDLNSQKRKRKSKRLWWSKK